MFMYFLIFFYFITNHYTLEVKLTVCSEKPACICIQPLACDKSTFFCLTLSSRQSCFRVHQVGWMLFVVCNFQTVPQTLNRIQIWSFTWFSECDCSLGLLQRIQTHLILLKPGAFAFILRHYRRGWRTQRDFNILWFFKKYIFWCYYAQRGISPFLCPTMFRCPSCHMCVMDNSDVAISLKKRKSAETWHSLSASEFPPSTFTLGSGDRTAFTLSRFSCKLC